ncbi:MAG TPA: ATP-binding protein [Acidobacteriota bacterium]|nr:ATP-binding protein [Acidobacteriota bacterium]
MKKNPMNPDGRSNGNGNNLWQYNEPYLPGVGIDMAERKPEEEAYSESLENLNPVINCIGDPIFIKDRKFRHILVNDALCAWTGRQREELIGKTAQEAFPGDIEILDALQENETLLFETGRETLTEDELPDPRGRKRTVMTRKSMFVDKKGGKHIIGVVRDITELKRLEIQYQQAQKMEAIGLLAGGIAHDFNNLLNVINGYTELALENIGADDPARGDLENVINAGRQAASLTSQLLAFSRKQIRQAEIMDLNEIVDEMSSMLHRVLGEDIELVTITQPDSGLVSADHGQVQQIIMNLAVNARDAMPNGGKLTIETGNIDFDEEYVRTHPLVKSGRFILLAISDNGMGMDAETQSHLFEPFFTTKIKGHGTGLGLSTVYGIVKQNNGFIWVYSEPGKGTTFKIYFPRVEGKTRAHAAGKTMESDLQGSETILLVEDDEAVMRLTSRILGERGYNVLAASNGMEALTKAGEYAGRIDLVLTDVVMPEISGKELVSKIEAVRPGCKTLYISGYTDNAIIRHGILNSDIAFLQKPFAVDDLARKVREVLNS